MRKIILFLTFILTPVFGVIANDIIVNNQSTYAVPPGSSKVLILDLTLPENLNSIKILNLGNAQQWDISAIYIFEDGASLGFDGDENEIVRKTSSPFWDTEISANSSQPRIFVAVGIASTAASGRTVKPQATINFDKTIIGLERTILAGASMPEVPQAPLARSGEAISAWTIRWHFLDLSNNEFGFRLKDNSLKTLVENQNPNLSYLDETGLKPSTCYSGRRASAFNDRGESSAFMNFAEVCTLALPVVEIAEEIAEEIVETQNIQAGKEPTLFETIQTKIADIQRQVNELLQKINELIKQQISAAQASLFRAFEIFVNLFQ